MTAGKKVNYLNILIFAAFFLLYLAVTLFLFHRQSVTYDGKYVSDLPFYITGMKSIRNNLFSYPLLFLTGRVFYLFTSAENAMALAVTCLNGLSVVILKYFLDIRLQVREQNNLKMGIFSTLLTFSLFFSAMLFPLTYLGQYHDVGPDYLYRYLGTFTPNPYHNATYLAARPFSVAAFFLFADALSMYETENKWFHPKYLWFGAFLFLTTLAKPSFTLVLAGTAGLIMLWRLIAGRFKQVKAFFQFGIYFIPTFLLLLYEYTGMFHAEQGQENGIGLGFLTAWSTASDNVLRSLLLGMAFPLAVLIFQLVQNKKLPDLLRLSWQFYLVALATMLFLYENNSRLTHLNFSWGYMYGLFFAYTASLLQLAKNTLKRRQPVWQLALQWLAYGLHLLCGFDYFRVLMQGGLFH